MGEQVHLGVLVLLGTLETINGKPIFDQKRINFLTHIRFFFSSLLCQY